MAGERRRRMSRHRGPVSETDEFWLYSKEAILSISHTRTDEDKQGLLDLARVWTVRPHERGAGSQAITTAEPSSRQIENFPLARYPTSWILRGFLGRELVPWIADE
jgi:hypothetical protein